MNKEDILKRAREENNGVDEVARSIEGEAARFSMALGAAVCMLLNLIDRIFLHNDAIGDTCWIIYGTMISSRLWFAGISLKQKGSLIGAVLTSVFVILLTIFLFVGA